MFTKKTLLFNDLFNFFKFICNSLAHYKFLITFECTQMKKEGKREKTKKLLLILNFYIMESLKKFQNKQIKGNSIFGGRWIQTAFTVPNFVPSNCVTTAEDNYFDSNGDGIWNIGETGSICYATQCGK